MYLNDVLSGINFYLFQIIETNPGSLRGISTRLSTILRKMEDLYEPKALSLHSAIYLLIAIYLTWSIPVTYFLGVAKDALIWFSTDCIELLLTANGLISFRLKGATI